MKFTFLLKYIHVCYFVFLDRLQEIDINYSSYFYIEVGDNDGETGTRKRKKNDRTFGAPEEGDWEKARYFIIIIFINQIC